MLSSSFTVIWKDYCFYISIPKPQVMKMSIVILAVMAACIFTDVKAQEFSLVASADYFDGYLYENPLSSPYAIFRSINIPKKKDTRFYSTLVSKANRTAKIFDLTLMEKISFYPSQVDIVNASVNHELEIQHPVRNNIKFSNENFNGFNYALVDFPNGEKIQLGKISNGAIEVNGKRTGPYLLIVHQGKEYYSQLIDLE